MTSDHWTRCVSSLDGKVYWHNAATGVSTWEEPGTSYIRNAIRNAEHTAALQRRAADASNGGRRKDTETQPLFGQQSSSSFSGSTSPSSGHSGGGPSGFAASARRRASQFFLGYSHHHPENSSSSGEALSHASQRTGDVDDNNRGARSSRNLPPNSYSQPSASSYRGATTSLDQSPANSPANDAGVSTML